MSDAQAPRPHRRRLGNELRRLREFTGQTQRQLGQVIGANQTAVDRIEKGGPEGKPPSWPRVEAWALACQAANPDMAELRLLTEDALDEHTLYKHLMSEGLAAVQDEIRTEESAALVQRNFNPWGVPGLLQTPEYARRVATITDFRGHGGIEDAVQARMRRQQILHEPAHRFEFLLTERGLRWRPGPAPVLVAQLAHLADMAALPTVTLSVIPSGVLEYAWPAFGFVVFEELTDGEPPWVAVELYHKREIAKEPDDVAIYRAQYDLLHRPAISGDDAVWFIREVEKSLS